MLLEVQWSCAERVGFEVGRLRTLVRLPLSLNFYKCKIVTVSYYRKGGMLWAQATMKFPSILLVEWYSNVYWIRTWGSRSYREINYFFFSLLAQSGFFLENFSVFLEYGSISVQFSCSVVSNSWQPRELQHARPPCPSPIPGVHSNSHPSSRWCHPTISSSVVPFSSCPQSLPASESFHQLH